MTSHAALVSGSAITAEDLHEGDVGPDSDRHHCTAGFTADQASHNRSSDPHESRPCRDRAVECALLARTGKLRCENLASPVRRPGWVFRGRPTWQGSRTPSVGWGYPIVRLQLHQWGGG